MGKENIFNPEYKKEAGIDLSLVEFNFCDEEKIKDDFAVEIGELENKEKWLNSNKNWLHKNKDKIAELIKTGMLSDNDPESIRKMKLKGARKRLERVLFVKKELEKNIDVIKSEVINKLTKFLSNWTPDKISIDFTLNKNADFCIKNKRIIVDLSRLSFEKDYLKEAINGVTHELFHAWQKDGLYLHNHKSDSVNSDSKEGMVFGALNEGLAVLIGGQDLKMHHEAKGKDYDSYKKESFDNFNLFLTTKNSKQAEDIINKAFKDMGYFYVVGNEIAKAVFEKEGIDKFRKLIEDMREDGSDEFLRIYKEICKTNKDLLVVQ